AGSYIGVGSVWQIRFEEAESALRMAITLCDKLVIDYPEKLDCWCTLAQGHQWLGGRQAAAGRHDEAGGSVRKSRALLGRVTDETASKRFLQAGAFLGLARLLHADGRTRESEEAYRQAFSRYQKIVDDLPHTPSQWINLLTCCRGLMRLLTQNGRHEEA